MFNPRLKYERQWCLCKGNKTIQNHQTLANGVPWWNVVCCQESPLNSILTKFSKWMKGKLTPFKSSKKTPNIETVLYHFKQHFQASGWSSNSASMERPGINPIFWLKWMKGKWFKLHPRVTKSSKNHQTFHWTVLYHFKQHF